MDVDEINNNRRKRDWDYYHITLISKRNYYDTKILDTDGIKTLQNFVSEYMSEYTNLGKIGFLALAKYRMANRNFRHRSPRVVALRKRLGLS